MTSPQRPKSNPPVPVARPVPIPSGPAVPPPPPRGAAGPPAASAAPFQLQAKAVAGKSAAGYRARKQAVGAPLIVGAVVCLAAVVVVGGLGMYFATSGSPSGNAKGKTTVAKAVKKKVVAAAAQKTQAAPAKTPTAPIPVALPKEPEGQNQTGGDFQFQPMVVVEEPVPAATPTDSKPAASVTLPPASSAPPAPPVAAPDPAAPEQQFEQAVLALHAANNLLLKKEYPTLRKLAADRFARLHDGEIRQGLGADYEAMSAWLSEHDDIRDELFTAIRPEADKIPAVLALLNELRKEFPDKIVPYANLAIATAVVWDEPRRGVYDYAHHASRCQANLPASQLAAIENFRYLVAAESVMQGRIQYVPWEFLVHVVNHRTPEPERVWAVQNFVGKRTMFGKCYSDVPYDYEMLNRGAAKLSGKDYTLPNILVNGGVCAMQADFASRVGKSLGVAAEYVRGAGSDTGLHAWVMWIELKQATPTGLVFSLESHGRYRGDKYYVGLLADPQTGQEITDRDMELRLQTVGLDTTAKRQAALVMQVYPLIREKSSLDVSKQLLLLNQTIALSPGCEEAWVAVAQLARESSGQKEYSKQFVPLFEKLFVTFALLPDFTWKVFDDLAAYQADPKLRDGLYLRLVQMYEAAGRPDLACEARLKLTDYLVEQGKTADAIHGLAFTVKKFPDEGRHVPRLLDRIDALCADAGFKDADKQLVGFYTEFLPLIPQMRGDEPSPFCIATYERAIALFQKHQQPQLVQACQLELANVKAGKGRKKS